MFNLCDTVKTLSDQPGERLNSLHVEERMEQGVDKGGCQRQEAGHVLLECCVDSVIVVCRDLEVLFELNIGMYKSILETTHLTHLEQVLLVAQGFLLLVPELHERVVVPIIIRKLHSFSFLPSSCYEPHTLCSRFVIVFLIVFNTPWNSLSGAATRLSIRSNSGAIAPWSSSMHACHASTFLTVSAQSGFLPMRSYSPVMGWKRVPKLCDQPEPAVKRAVSCQTYAIEFQGHSWKGEFKGGVFC